MNRQLQIFCALAIVATPCMADELPQRKAGLWETTTNVDGHSVTVRHCIGATVDPLFKSMQALAGSVCSKQVVARTSDGYRSEYSCKLGEISIDGQTTVVGDLNSAFTLDSESVRQGMPNRPEPVTRVTHAVARWLGPCEAGQNPGDVILPDGRVMRSPAVR